MCHSESIIVSDPVSRECVPYMAIEFSRCGKRIGLFISLGKYLDTGLVKCVNVSGAHPFSRARAMHVGRF